MYGHNTIAVNTAMPRKAFLSALMELCLFGHIGDTPFYFTVIHGERKYTILTSRRATKLSILRAISAAVSVHWTQFTVVDRYCRLNRFENGIY